MRFVSACADHCPDVVGREIQTVQRAQELGNHMGFPTVREIAIQIGLRLLREVCVQCFP